MTRVRAIDMEGIECFFPSNDHLSPHFHAKCGDWEIRVFVLTTTARSLDYSLKRGKARDIPRRGRGELARAVSENKEALLLEWEAIHGGE